MTPDRELTDEETKQLVKERATGTPFSGLEAHAREKTKPTLYDLCILELWAAVQGMEEILVKQGREIRALRNAHK